jgi:protein-S-isoprenylcysteine O-methyltransferase Ste14
VLFWKALFAFLVLPGMVAFAVPLLLFAHGPLADAWCLIPLVLGICLLLWCVREFYAAGHGTLAPWTPPAELVVTGLYRYSRNPMYVAVAVILWGWAIGFGSRGLAIYALVVMVVFHLRVVLNEEPFLARTHGDAWQRYKARVPRWLGLPRG